MNNEAFTHMSSGSYFALADHMQYRMNGDIWDKGRG